MVYAHIFVEPSIGDSITNAVGLDSDQLEFGDLEFGFHEQHFHCARWDTRSITEKYRGIVVISTVYPLEGIRCACYYAFGNMLQYCIS